MTSLHARAPALSFAWLLPPALYFGAADGLLALARRLFRAKIIPGRGLVSALSWSRVLVEAGMRSRRDRRRLSRA